MSKREEIEQGACNDCVAHLTRNPMGAAARSMLRHWVIYKHPRDFPRHWVVRTWHLVRDAGEPIHEAVGCLCDSLEEARDSVPPWSYNLGRFDADDPAIFEVWI